MSEHAPSPPAAPPRVATMLATLRRGYDRRSLVALGVLVAVYTAVGVNWWHLLDWSRGMDWLLAGIWLFMTAVLCWDLKGARDLPLVLVAAVGGLVIEGWGTQTRLWSYFTVERPPVWILPAWPVAALAIDRIARVIDPLGPRTGARWLYWPMVTAFIAAMVAFLWPTIDLSMSRVVVVLMLGVALTVRDHRQEVVLFVAGSLLGIFLEYWGTSRRCWTYYTAEIPPPVAVVAHGFASVAFLRGTQLLQAILRRVRA
ncbi:MAG: hypothetical protein H6742_12340 [Alphaproteobacteria bacterium]|nr:hypothetical protein [Alphaproteobacteria bacterium]